MAIKPVKKRGSGVPPPVVEYEAFPSARYFQVHFEYLEHLLAETHSCLDALKREVAGVHRTEPAAPHERLGQPFARRTDVSLRGDDLSARPLRRNGKSSGTLPAEES